MAENQDAIALGRCTMRDMAENLCFTATGRKYIQRSALATRTVCLANLCDTGRLVGTECDHDLAHPGRERPTPGRPSVLRQRLTPCRAIAADPDSHHSSMAGNTRRACPLHRALECVSHWRLPLCVASQILNHGVHSLSDRAGPN